MLSKGAQVAHYCPRGRGDAPPNSNAVLENWNLVVNRLYYDVFCMVLALLLKTYNMPKSHNGHTSCVTI